MWIVIAKHLPDNPGDKPKLRAAHLMYETRAEAEEYVNKVRRQNLPFRGYVAQIELPSECQDGTVK